MKLSECILNYLVFWVVHLAYTFSDLQLCTHDSNWSFRERVCRMTANKGNERNQYFQESWMSEAAPSCFGTLLCVCMSFILAPSLLFHFNLLVSWLLICSLPFVMSSSLHGRVIVCLPLCCCVSCLCFSLSLCVSLTLFLSPNQRQLKSEPRVSVRSRCPVQLVPFPHLSPLLPSYPGVPGLSAPLPLLSVFISLLLAVILVWLGRVPSQVICIILSSSSAVGVRVWMSAWRRKWVSRLVRFASIVRVLSDVLVFIKREKESQERNLLPSFCECVCAWWSVVSLWAEFTFVTVSFSLWVHAFLCACTHHVSLAGVWSLG